MKEMCLLSSSGKINFEHLSFDQGFFRDFCQVRAIATSEISPGHTDAYCLQNAISMLMKGMILGFSSVFEASGANILSYGIKIYVQALVREKKIPPWGLGRRGGPYIGVKWGRYR